MLPAGPSSYYLFGRYAIPPKTHFGPYMRSCYVSTVYKNGTAHLERLQEQFSFKGIVCTDILFPDRVTSPTGCKITRIRTGGTNLRYSDQIFFRKYPSRDLPFRSSASGQCRAKWAAWRVSPQGLSESPATIPLPIFPPPYPSVSSHSMVDPPCVFTVSESRKVQNSCYTAAWING